MCFRPLGRSNYYITLKPASGCLRAGETREEALKVRGGELTFQDGAAPLGFPSSSQREPLKQDLANFFSKEPDNGYFWLCGLDNVCCNCFVTATQRQP